MWIKVIYPKEVECNKNKKVKKKKIKQFRDIEPDIG